jgi:hypothetical protein
MDISNLNLHAAALVSVKLVSPESTCLFCLASAELPKCVLIFSGVSGAILPKKRAWESSASINLAVALGGCSQYYRIRHGIQGRRTLLFN